MTTFCSPVFFRFAALYTAAAKGKWWDFEMRLFQLCLRFELPPSHVSSDNAKWNSLDQCWLFSRSILCYLVNKYGRDTEQNSQLYPLDPEQRAMVDRLLFFDNGTLYKNIVDYFVILWIWLEITYDVHLYICSTHSWCRERMPMSGRRTPSSSRWITWICSWRRRRTSRPITWPLLTSPSWPRWPSWREWTTESQHTREHSKCLYVFKIVWKAWLMSSLINILLVHFFIFFLFFRNLYKWVERLKSELPYYESCNTGDIMNKHKHFSSQTVIQVPI